MWWELQCRLPLRVLMVQCRRDPIELHHEVGLVAVQLVEKIPITHEMENGAAEVLLFLFCIGLDALEPRL